MSVRFERVLTDAGLLGEEVTVALWPKVGEEHETVTGTLAEVSDQAQRMTVLSACGVIAVPFESIHFVDSGQ